MKKKLNKIAKDTNIFLKNFLNKQTHSKFNSSSMKYSLFLEEKKLDRKY